MSKFPITDYSEYKGLERLDKGSYTDCGNGTPAKQVVVCNLSDIDNRYIETDIAGQNISAVKAIYYDGNTLMLANNDDSLQARAIGISINGALSGSPVKYITAGKLSDSSFNFIKDEYLYLDKNGNITNTPTTTVGEFVTKIGYSLGGSEIFIQIDQPIEIC